jgi:hypothetical protein
MQTLNIAVNAPSVTYAQLLVAQADGLFAKNCLTANVNWSVATSIPATLAAGQYDIGISTITTPMSMLLSGKQTELIYNLNNNPMPAIITGKQYKTIADVQGIKGCTIFALSPGSVVYAQTVQLTKTIFTNCGVTAASTGVTALPEVNEAVSSGHFPVGVSIYQFVEPSVSANQVNLLVNPLKPTAQLTNIFHPDTFPVLAAFGLPSDLSGKQAAVTDFAKAMDQALPIIQSSSPSALAALTLSKISAFQGQTTSSLTVGWEQAKLLLEAGPPVGSISAAQWKTVLAQVPTWGVTGISASTVTNPAFDYSKFVNMSYVQAASS